MKAPDILKLIVFCGLALFCLSACEVEEPGGEEEEPIIGMKFKLITVEPFTMGSPESEGGRETDEVQHEVTITQDFRILETEVTQAKWEEVMGNNPSSNACPECPVVNVSYTEVGYFIDELNADEEGTYRLPTEAEWEYAARAGNDTAFDNGDITEFGCGEKDDNLDEVGWYCYNSDNSIHDVKGQDDSAYNLYDMHGNAMEWVADWYGAYPEEAVTDPTGPETGDERVVRGGGFRSYPPACRSAMRTSFSESYKNDDLGFRLVYVPDTVE